MIKCKMRINRIMYPRDKEVEAGDFVIFTAKVLKLIEGEEPKKHPSFNTVSLKGNIPKIREGYDFVITFDSPETNKYGTTYNVLSVVKEINEDDSEEVLEYLKLVCGNKIAFELIKLEKPYTLLKERNDEELLKVKGIKEARLRQIYKNIETYSDNSLAYVKLQPLGLTKVQIGNICLALGGATNAIEVCFNNAYSLIDKVKGIGFKTADEIALKCGMDPYSPIRIKSAITYLLSESGENGKSFLYASQLIQELRKVVHMELHQLTGIIQEMSSEGKIIVSQDGLKVALPYYLLLEQNIALEIKRIKESESVIEIPDNWMDLVREIEEKQGWTHTEEQLKGIEMVLKENIAIISGKAGTGKSTVTNAMSTILKEYMIALCCLSAKASQRLREVTKLETYTIHRLLNLNMSENEEHTMEPNLLEDIVIIDEASMVSGTLFYKLLKSIKSGAKVIILGDSGQLTAIGNCSVFSDMMLSGVIPHIELTKIHRQAEKSAIITKSIDFREQVEICCNNFSGHTIMGELQDLELFVINQDDILETIKNEFMKQFKLIDDILEVQIITPLKTRGNLSTKNINLEIQNLVSPKVGRSFKGKDGIEIFVGDKVINLKNDYKARNTAEKVVGVWNGSIGIVEDIIIEDDSLEVIVNFSGIGRIVIEKDKVTNISLAYAISCHSSQGSQWRSVIFGMDMSAYVLLNVEMVYTSLTRAREHCEFICDRKSLNHSIRTIEQKTKQTLLAEMLKEVI